MKTQTQGRTAMKKQMIRTRRFTKFTAKLAGMVFFGALLVAVPFHTAMAQTVPDLGTADSFAVLGGTAVTLTNSTVMGDVGSPGAVTVTTSTVLGTVFPAGDPIAVAAYEDFLIAYDTLALEVCEFTLTGDLAGLVLAPGVYCVGGASTTTNGTLTLDAQGDPNAVWVFKIGTLGSGALTGTGFTVAMDNGGQPCNVYWWVADAVTMSASNLKGTVLAGAASTFTGGSLIGQVFAKAGVTMTGTDVFGCNTLVPPVIDEKFCKKYCHKYCKNNEKKHKKPCNQGVGNGSEDCDPGRSNQGNQSRSNDERGGIPGDPGRKGGNGK